MRKDHTMLLLTAYNDHQAPLGDLTAPLMEDYARRHKMGFRCVRFSAEGKEAYWQKIIETLRAFDEGFDRVFWLDADQAITNPDLTPLGYEHGFVVSKDWGTDATEEHHFSMCGYVACRDSWQAFLHVNSRHDECINGDFPEQTPMREFYEDHADPHKYKLLYSLPRRSLNAVPDEVSPGSVPEPWQPGDFAAHITMVPLEKRIELFHKVMRQIKR